jgi:hypothetical protein
LRHRCPAGEAGMDLYDHYSICCSGSGLNWDTIEQPRRAQRTPGQNCYRLLLHTNVHFHYTNKLYVLGFRNHKTSTNPLSSHFVTWDNTEEIDLEPRILRY